MRDSARIYGVIFAGFFRLISTSLICFLVDYGLYLLLNNLLKVCVPTLEHEFRFLFVTMLARILVATIVARVVSGTLNFFLNTGLTSSLHLWLGMSDNTAKIPVDIALFFLSYQLQRKWVFNPKRKAKSDVEKTIGK